MYIGGVTLARTRKSSARKRSDRVVFYVTILITIAVISAVVYFFYSYALSQNRPQVYQSVFEMSIVIAQPNGTRTDEPIPANVGVQGGNWNWHNLDQYGVDGRAPMYTLDTTGLIRIQSTVARNYTLGDFFRIWGVTFNDTCIQTQIGGPTYCNYTSDGSGMFWTVYRNGEANYFDFQGILPLRNDVIRVDYAPAT